MLRNEEKYAKDILAAHFDGQGCHVGEGDDPPDLIIRWKNGERWGVEVTQAFLKIQAVGSRKITSERAVMEALQKFGEHLGRLTSEYRNRGYFLSLNVNDPFGQLGKNWKRDIEEQVCHHIKTQPNEELRIRGCTLKPREIGAKWSILPFSGLIPEPDKAAKNRFIEAVEKKANGLSGWQSGFDQKWLFLFVKGPWGGENMSDALLAHAVDGGEIKQPFDGLFWAFEEENCRQLHMHRR